MISNICIFTLSKIYHSINAVFISLNSLYYISIVDMNDNPIEKPYSYINVPMYKLSISVIIKEVTF